MYRSLAFVCAYVYVADTNLQMNSLELVMKSKYVRFIKEVHPVIVPVLGETSELSNFMQKMCRKHGMLAFSINCPVPIEVLQSIETYLSN